MKLNDHIQTIHIYLYLMKTQLNLPPFEIKLKGDLVWAILRKKWLKLTPEEWVRQHFINYLLNHKGFSSGRLVAEHEVKYNGMSKRCDIAYFNESFEVNVIVECKAPHIEITEDTFYQAARYSRTLGAKFLILTNGVNHYCAQINPSDGSVQYIPEIPEAKELI